MFGRTQIAFTPALGSIEKNEKLPCPKCETEIFGTVLNFEQFKVPL